MTRDVTQQVVFILLSRDFLESSEQIVCVENWKSAGPFCQFIKQLLIYGRRRREGRNDRPRLRIVSVSVSSARTASSASAPGATSSACTTFTSASRAARAARSTSARATGSSASATVSTTPAPTASVLKVGRFTRRRWLIRGQL